MANRLTRLSRARLGLFRSPSKAFPFWLFVGLCLLVGYYYAIEIPKQQSRILKSDFGFLASESDQVRSLLQSYRDILRTEVRQEQKKSWKTELKGAALVAQLNKWAQAELFVDCQEDSILLDSQGKTSGPKGEIVLSLHRYTSLLTAHMEYSDSNKVHERCLDAPLGDQLDRIIGSHIERFDGVVLALSSGEVLYQKAQNGFRLGDISPLLEEAFRPKEANLSSASAPRSLTQPGAKGPDSLGSAQPSIGIDWRKVSYTALVEAEFEAERYKLLIQPVPISIHIRASNSTGQDTEVTPLLVGVVSQNRLSSSATELSWRYATPVVIIVLLLLLALWPVLKVWKMAPSDGFSKAELLFLACSLLGAVALVTLVTLYVKAKLDNSRQDTRLKLLACAIDRNLAAELNNALEVLGDASGSEFLAAELSMSRKLDNSRQDTRLKLLACAIDRNLAAELNSAPKVLGDASGSKSPGAELSRSRKAAEPRAASSQSVPMGQRPGEDPWYMTQKSILSCPKGSDCGCISHILMCSYPWLDQLAWMDKDGKQIVKWSVQEEPTRQISFGDFAFFPRIQACELWKLKPQGYNTTPFLLGPVRSPNTGRFLPIVLERVKVKSDDRVEVGALSSYLMSVTDPILPPQYGFAIVDESGAVQFHSDPARNLGENLLHRVEPAESLRRVIATGQEDGFSADYLERPVRMYASPLRNIQGDKWSLVTWRSLEAREQFLTRVFGRALCLSIAYVAVFGVICVASYLLARRRQKQPIRLAGMPWYLPSIDKAPNISTLLLFYIAATGIDTYVLKHCTSSALWIALALSPPVLALGTWIIMRTRLPPFLAIGGASKVPRVRFLIAISAAALLLGSLPAIGFSKLYWDRAVVPYVRGSQFELLGLLRDRRHSVRQGMRTIEAGGQDIATRRLGENSDRYDLEFLKEPNSSDLLWLDDPDRVPGELPIVSELQPYPLDWLTIVEAVGVGLIIICLATWSTLFYRFQWHHKMPTPIEEVKSLVPGENMLILARPWQDVRGLLPPGIEACECSLHEAPATDRWQAGNPGFVFARGLEEALLFPKGPCHAWNVLEQIVQVPGKTLIIVSAVDPLYWLRDAVTSQVNPNDDRQDDKLFHECANGLSALTKRRLSWIPEEPLTLRQCQLLWRCCTRREKLVLWHLVREGLPNPKNGEALDSLIERGLVARRDAMFHVVSPTLADFVGSELPAAEIDLLFPPESDSAWRGLRWVIIYLLGLVFLVIAVRAFGWWENPLLRVFTVVGGVGGLALPIFKTAFDLLPGIKKGSRSLA